MPLDLPNPTDLAVPGFIVLMLAEMIYGRMSGRAVYEGKDTLTSLLMGTGSVVAGLIPAGLGYGAAYYIWSEWRLLDRKSVV